MSKASAELGLCRSGVSKIRQCAFFFSSRRGHTRFKCDWSSEVCSSDLARAPPAFTSAGISGSDLDVVEAGGARAVTGADHLLRLAFAAVGHAPEDPMIAIGDGGAGIQIGRASCRERV